MSVLWWVQVLRLIVGYALWFRLAASCASQEVVCTLGR